MILAAALGALALAGAPACQEDDPCWTWPIMGNRQRGVVTMWGTPKNVTCGDLRWLVRHGDLDPFTPRLKGDAMCGRSRAYDRRVKREMAS